RLAPRPPQHLGGGAGPVEAHRGQLTGTGSADVLALRASILSSQLSTGVVMGGVISATSTSTVNSSELAMRADRPTFRAISCIRPRAFIRAAMRLATGPGSPSARAAAQQPPNLPMMATATQTAAKISRAGSVNRPNSVFRPE